MIYATSTHFEIFIFIQQWITKNMWYIGQLYVFLITSLQKFWNSKFSLYKNVKGAKKGFTSFYKVILLAPLNVFAPFCVFLCMQKLWLGWNFPVIKLWLMGSLQLQPYSHFCTILSHVIILGPISILLQIH